MLVWNRAWWVSHQMPSCASSRWFRSPASFASLSIGRQGRSQREALDLSRKDWLATLTPPQQEHEEEEEVAALAQPVVSNFLHGEDSVVATPNALVIGIDPDVSGAMAVLHGNDITTAEVFDVPSLRVLVGSQHRRRHDTRSIVSMIKDLNAPTGFGYGIWIGTLVASGISVVPVPSLAWKRSMGLYGKFVTKDDCRACASLMFPSLASQLKRKKDHGRAEALLIAAHGKGIFAPAKEFLAEARLDEVQSSER